MNQLSVTKYCPDCGRDNLVKNGAGYKGAQQFRCNACGANGALDVTGRYTPERKEEILHACQEQSGMRVSGAPLG